MPDKINKTETEWKTQLTPEQYHVTRERGTERAFSGQYYRHHAEGTYQCVCCENALFASTHKYDSGSGWPSFTTPMESHAVHEQEDLSYGMQRVEVSCSRCDAHLGHVFEDGPPPTGQRYCINSAALNFRGAAGDT